MAKRSILIFLSLLVFSTISGAFSYDWKQNLLYQQKLQELDQGIIQCRPSRSSADLWTCYDSYGNEFSNLKITQVK